jgi:hypothetical protein
MLCAGEGPHTDQAWFALSPREITDAIYREIRAIDREAPNVFGKLMIRQ